MTEESLGEAVRCLRERQHLSLRALAAHTDFSPSFLSQIENGQCSPSISSMERIAKALGVTLWQFFRGAESASANVVRADARPHLKLEWSRAEIESLGILGEGSQFHAVMVKIEPGGISGEYATASINDEFAFVSEGRCVLVLDDVEQTLEKGDSVTIPMGVCRQWRNETDEIAQILISSIKPFRPNHH